MPKAKIIQEECDGYERLYLLELTDTKERIFAYGLDVFQYDETLYSDKKIGMTKECSFSIEWVNELQVAEFDVEKLVQPVKN